MDINVVFYAIGGLVIWAIYSVARRFITVVRESDKTFTNLLLSFLLYILLSAAIGGTLFFFGFLLLFHPGHAEAVFAFVLVPVGLAVGALFGSRLWLRR